MVVIMDLQPSQRRKHSEVILDNSEEAHLFIDVGLGTLSIKGLLLAKKASAMNKPNDWPLVTTISNNRLLQVTDRMNEHAALLGTRVGFDGTPAGLEDELAIRNMVSVIIDHLQTTLSDL